MNFEFDSPAVRPPCLKVIGIGGGGGNAVNAMIHSGHLGSVEFAVANTDLQALKRNDAPMQIQLGVETTKGQGAGADPSVGREAALEDQPRIADALYGADMVFVTCGMGGGTGTGAAPVVAQVARELGALTVGVVTRPFWFEGNRRAQQAERGIAELRKVVDTLIVIRNDQLLSVASKKTPFTEALALADEVLMHAVGGIAEVIEQGGLINVDFADVRTIMTDKGAALMGSGRAAGEGRAEAAARMAIASPLLEDVRIDGAKGLLVNVTGSATMGLQEIQEAVSLVQEQADPEATVIFGAVIDENMGEELKVTVIATGLQEAEAAPAVAPGQARAVSRRMRRHREAPTPEQWGTPAFARRAGHEEARMPTPVALPQSSPAMVAVRAGTPPMGVTYSAAAGRVAPSPVPRRAPAAVASDEPAVPAVPAGQPVSPDAYVPVSRGRAPRQQRAGGLPSFLDPRSR